MMDMESVDMCDVKKYYNIYDELKKLKPGDTLQLIMEADWKSTRLNSSHEPSSRMPSSA